jgi:hypothetical protein
MPFLYTLTLQPDENHYTFVQQLIPTGTLVATGQPVATLTDGAMEYHVPAPLQGLLVEWHVHHGDPIENEDPLARIVCEGEPQPVPPAVPYRLG